MVANTVVQAGIVQRFIQYFVDRKKKLAVIGIVCFILWVAKRRGYLKRLFSFSLQVAEERMNKHLEATNQEMMRQSARAEDFSKTLKEFHEKFPTLAMNNISRHLDVVFEIDQIKEGLKNKGLDQAEKTKKWQQFREAVCRGTILTLVARSYLWSIWLIRDILQAKIKNSLDELVKSSSYKDTKFLSDSFGATQDFINSFVEGVISHTMNGLSETVAKLSSKLEFKLTDKVSVETLIAKLEEVKADLLTKYTIGEGEVPDQYEISIRRLGVTKSSLKFSLVHKRALNRPFSLRKTLANAFSTLFKPSSNKLQTEFTQTVFSQKVFGSFRDYQVDLQGYSLVSYFVAETRRKSAEHLSPIAEVGERDEDQSGDVEEDLRQRRANQLIYEEKTCIEGKNYEKQQFIISSLEKLVHNGIKEFLDFLTSANCQLLTETALEFNFKKLATRLELFKQFNVENQGNLVYLKLLTSLNKIVEEEIINKQAAKNDVTLYEARTKELFKLANKQEVDKVEAALVNVYVAQEAKGHAMVQRSTREWAARMFYEEEFDQYYGEEFEVSDNQKESPAKSEQRELMEMLSKLKPPELGTSISDPLESLLRLPQAITN